MGYEINFSFHPRKEDGQYDMEVKNSFSKNVGKRNVEVPVEQVAAIVLAQLARRDIWIVGAEIFEYIKREVSFKETKSGIVIKNRKFQYDQVAGHLISEDDEEEKPKPIISNQPIISAINEPPKTDSNRPIRQELFRPAPDDYPQLMKQGIKLTMDKPYPIFGEVIRGNVVYYIVQDDAGNRTQVSSLFFEPVPRGLSFIGPQTQEAPAGKLSYVASSPIVPRQGGDLGAMIAAQDAAIMRRR